MSIVFDRAVAYYDRTRGLPPAAESAMAAVLRESTTLESGSRVLEIGVGTGRIALPLAIHNGYRYTGVDLSLPMLSVLRRKPGADRIALARANVAALPFRDESFNALVAVHVFHLIDRWRDAMDEARRVLRPGGLLVAGGSRDAPESDARGLRHMLDQLAGGGESRRAVGLLDWDGVRRELESRFGPPREVITEPWQTVTTPREIIDAYESRIWSSTWSLSDAALTQAAAEARHRAIERWGDLDAPLIEDHRFLWNVFTG